jgi:hypothetical protein
VIGRCYLLAGEPVVVLTQWGLKSRGETHGGPRNVRILFVDGSRTVRPFRGLRRLNVRRVLLAGASVSRRVPQSRRAT